jgi:hypothetical protein
MNRILIFLLLLMPFLSKAQKDSTDISKIVFNADFKFKDGFFLSFEDVRRNNPFPKSRIITDVNYNDYAFFEKVLENGVFAVLDDLGQRQEINSKNIWGFSQNGTLFIQWNDEFNRIPVFGSICHFIADKTYIDNRNNPYYNNYYNSYNYYNPYGYPNSQTVQTELRQYMLDMETGKVMDFDTKNVEVLLARDQELYAEFANLKNKKKEVMKFLYLRKYNEKNPFYFLVEK